MAHYVAVPNDIAPPPYSQNPFASVSTIDQGYYNDNYRPRSSDETLVDPAMREMLASEANPQPRKWFAGFFKPSDGDLENTFGDFIHPKVDQASRSGGSSIDVVQSHSSGVKSRA